MSDKERPNVVVILMDDMGPWAMGCCGNPEIRTPNIDRLARQGVRLENFFCTSPVCSPARATLLTGRIPSQHGVHDWIRDRNMPPEPARYLEEFTCYTDILAQHGYVCGLSGKWHLGDSLTPRHGFEHWYVMPEGYSGYRNAKMIRDGQVLLQPGYLTDAITADALQFIEANADRRFYLSLHHFAPHAPWTGHPPEIVDSYDDCPFGSCPQEPKHPWAGPLTQRALGNREMLKGYFAAVTAADKGIGRILDRLEEKGLRHTTLVVFTSDNGFSCGQHGFWGNGTYPLNMFENSVKVPFIVSQPGRLPAARVSEAMMSQYDFFPTLLDYLDLPWVHEKASPGVSLLPVWEGESRDGREEVVVFDEYGPVRMVRTHEWKYIHRYPYGPHELYDLLNDAAERENIVDRKEYRELTANMRTRLARWFDRHVVPARDGLRGGVSGQGQRNKIGPNYVAEESFYAPGE